MTLHYAPVHAFIRWMAAHPGYVICAVLLGYPGTFSVLMELRE